MYCSQCRRQLFYEDLNHHGWCEVCRRIVGVSQCSVSYWYITAAFVSLWAVQSGM
jgi:hypothetical protein